MSSATQQRMKRVVIDHFGGPEVLKVVEDDIPQPGPGEVRVRVLAAGVSFSDGLLRAGTYLGGPKPPFTPGYELVGVVEELGPGCSRLREAGVVSVDQAPIRGSRRSNPATYTGLLKPICKAFAKANGVKPALFNANSEGACPTCTGEHLAAYVGT